MNACPGHAEGFGLSLKSTNQLRNHKVSFQLTQLAPHHSLQGRFCHFQSTLGKGIEKSEPPVKYRLFLLNQVTNNMFNTL